MEKIKRFFGNKRNIAICVAAAVVLLGGSIGGVLAYGSRAEQMVAQQETSHIVSSLAEVDSNPASIEERAPSLYSSSRTVSTSRPATSKPVSSQEQTTQSNTNSRPIAANPSTTSPINQPAASSYTEPAAQPIVEETAPPAASEAPLVQAPEPPPVVEEQPPAPAEPTIISGYIGSEGLFDDQATARKHGENMGTKMNEDGTAFLYSGFVEITVIYSDGTVKYSIDMY